MEEIAKNLKLPLFTGLYKNCEYKQTNQRYEQRELVRNVIAIRDEHILENKDILLIDDVMTSGNTIMACINCLEKAKPQSIRVLVLARH